MNSYHQQPHRDFNGTKVTINTEYNGWGGGTPSYHPSLPRPDSLRVAPSYLLGCTLVDISVELMDDLVLFLVAVVLLLHSCQVIAVFAVVQLFLRMIGQSLYYTSRMDFSRVKFTDCLPFLLLEIKRRDTNRVTYKFVFAPVDTLLEEPEVFVRIDQSGFGNNYSLGGGVGFLLGKRSIVKNYKQAVLE